MSDLISRQAAQTELKLSARRYTVAHEAHGEGRVVWSEDLISVSDAMDTLRKIPSAQPEIIRCKECLWRIGRDCTRFTDLPVYMDDYCGRAKRRGEQDDESRSNSNAQTDTRARGMGATDKSSGI